MHAVKVPVMAPVCVECEFWREDDGCWTGRCSEISISVHGGSFEDTKRQLEEALAEHLLALLRLEKDVPADPFASRYVTTPACTGDDFINIESLLI
jgi:predicted RNase H-like HicB family nuclease